MQIQLLAALDRNHAIGRGGELPWHLPDDLKRFKALTMGHPILMGRLTAESIGRALPGRRNLVLTRSGEAPCPGQEPIASLQQAIDIAGDSDLMVIGGGQLYALALPLASQLRLTWVDTEVAGADAWFPQFDPAQWQVTSEQRHPADARHPYAFRFTDLRRV